MSTTLTPPPVPPQAPQPAGPRPNRSAALVITILVAALGAAIIAAAVWGGIRSTIRSVAASDDSFTVAVGAGVNELDVDISAADLTLRFDDVEEATLDVRDAASAWTLTADGTTLVVRTPDAPFMSWFGGGNGRAVLTLPLSLEGADADFDLGAGSLDVDGVFGEVSLGMGAGSARISGTATELTTDIGAGRAEIDLDGVDTADLSVSAGDIFARLRGDAPRDVTLSVSAGSLELTLPDAEYDVTTDVSAGNVDNGLRTSSAASSRVSAEVSAGSARLIAD